MRVTTATVLLLFVAVMTTAQEPPLQWTPLIIGPLTPAVGHFVWSDEKGEYTLQCKAHPSEVSDIWRAGDLYDCEIAPGRTLDGVVRLLQRIYEANDRAKNDEICRLRKKLAALSKWDVLPSGKFVQ